MPISVEEDVTHKLVIVFITAVNALVKILHISRRSSSVDTMPGLFTKAEFTWFVMGRYMETLRHNGNTLPSQPILAPLFQSSPKLVIASNVHTRGFISYQRGIGSQSLLIKQTGLSKDSLGKLSFLSVFSRLYYCAFNPLAEQVITFADSRVMNVVFATVLTPQV